MRLIMDFHESSLQPAEPSLICLREHTDESKRTKSDSYFLVRLDEVFLVFDVVLCADFFVARGLVEADLPPEIRARFRVA